MCSPMERDCRRRIEIDLECDDVNTVIDKMVARRDALFSELQAVESRIAAAISSSGKYEVAIPVRVAGRDWTISYVEGDGVLVQPVIPADSPLFAQPPVADAVADSPSDDDIDAVLDPHANLAVEIEREARRSREAIIRDGKSVAGLSDVLAAAKYDPNAACAGSTDIDPVAGLGGFLADRYGRPDPITQAAFDAAVDDELGPDGRDMLRALLDDDDETADSHAVVEHQAAS